MWWAQPVTSTSGEQSHGSHVTKRDLLAALLLPLQRGRLRIAAGLPLGETLERELVSFRVRLSAAGRDSYGVQRREGEGHGDLAIGGRAGHRRPNLTAATRVEESLTLG